MSYRTPDGKFRKPKEIYPPPSVNELIKFQKYWKYKTMTYLKEKKYFDQDVRTGVCYFCKKEGRAQKTKTTNLHHAKYDHSDPLAWTIEVCKSCHWQVDEHNRKQIARSTGKVIERRYGKYDLPYYENREEKITREERDRIDYYKRFCMNIDGKFIPKIELCPDRETYDELMEVMQREKTASKKDTMSSVALRYY